MADNALAMSSSEVLSISPGATDALIEYSRAWENPVEDAIQASADRLASEAGKSARSVSNVAGPQRPSLPIDIETASAFLHPTEPGATLNPAALAVRSQVDHVWAGELLAQVDAVSPTDGRPDTLGVELDEDAVVGLPAPKTGPGDGKINLVAAYGELSPLRDRAEALENVGWSGLAREMLPAALKLLKQYRAAPESERLMLRQHIKKEGNWAKMPKESNDALIAVNCCRPARDKAQQKAWSRFAVVVARAADTGVTEETTGNFLDNHSLRKCLELAKKTRKPEDNTPSPSVLDLLKRNQDFYKLLSRGKGRLYEEAIADIADLAAKYADRMHEGDGTGDLFGVPGTSGTARSAIATTTVG